MNLNIKSLFTEKSSVKILSVVAMVLMISDTIYHTLTWVNIRFYNKSALIPDWFYDEIARPHIVLAGFDLVVIVIALAFFMKSKYKATIATTILALVIQPFLPSF